MWKQFFSWEKMRPGILPEQGFKHKGNHNATLPWFGTKIAKLHAKRIKTKTWSTWVFVATRNATFSRSQLQGNVHSRPQSLRSFWPAAGIESSGSNHYERTKEITEFWLSRSLRICIYGACPKWFLPELSIPAAGQKDRRLWGREWVVFKSTFNNACVKHTFG